MRLCMAGNGQGKENGKHAAASIQHGSNLLKLQVNWNITAGNQHIR
jgi:hypothetical protein